MQNCVFIRGKVQYRKSLGINFIFIGVSIAIFSASPLFSKLDVLSTIKSPPVYEILLLFYPPLALAPQLQPPRLQPPVPPHGSNPQRVTFSAETTINFDYPKKSVKKSKREVKCTAKIKICTDNFSFGFYSSLIAKAIQYFTAPRFP